MVLMQKAHVLNRRVALTGLLILLTALCLAASALAVSPKKGAHFSGKTSEKRALSFSVSSSGTALDNFRFYTLGCLASPGATAFPVKVGQVKLAASGHFSVSGAKSVRVSGAVTTTVTVKVTGHFVTSKTAAGTISYSESAKTNVPGPKCTKSPPLTFKTTG